MVRSPKPINNFWLLSAITFMSLIYMEVCFRLFGSFELISFEFVRIIFFTLSTSLLIGFCLQFMTVKLAKTLLTVILLVFAFYAFFQTSFSNYLSRYFTLQDASYGVDKVMVFAFDFIFSIKPIFFIIFIPIPLILVVKNVYNSKPKKTTLIRLIKFVLLIAIIHFFSIGLLFINTNPHQLNKPYDIYLHVEHSSEAINQLGIFRFAIRDAYNFINPYDDIVIIDDDPVNEEPIIVDDPIIIDNKRYIDDTLWQELIASETNERILTIDNYFIKQPVAAKNEMTGIFKDKNLVLIMIEAFDYMAIDKTLTPTLYMMVNEGLFFDNFYSPQFSCATGQSEFAALTSLVPESASCTINTYAENDFYHSIFNLFNQHSYYSSSYHNWIYQYYYRAVVHESMYSSRFYGYDDLPFKRIQGWQSDKDLFLLALPNFVEHDRFFSFIITSSTHFPYDVASTLGDRYLDTIDDVYPDYPMEVKRYLSKAIELDKGLAVLLAHFEETDSLDTTVFVLFGDHHPLKMDTSLFNLYSYNNTDRSTSYAKSKTPFIIYNSEVTPNTYHLPLSPIDILPTLANLFDLNYDPRFYLGNDYFSTSDKLVYFSSGSWLNENGYYNASLSQFITFKDQDELTIEKLNEINNKVKNIFNIAKLIYRSDYYHYRHDVIFPQQ